MIECLFFSCVLIGDLLQQDFVSVEQNELFGFLNSDLNEFELIGIKSLDNKIVYLNSNTTSFPNVHSHPKTVNSLWGFLCIPSTNDFVAKKLLNTRKEYLYCGGSHVVVY